MFVAFDMFCFHTDKQGTQTGSDLMSATSSSLFESRNCNIDFPTVTRLIRVIAIERRNFSPYSNEQPSFSTYLPDDTLEAVLEPLDGLGLVNLVGGAELGLAASALGDALTRAGPR